MSVKSFVILLFDPADSASVFLNTQVGILLDESTCAYTIDTSAGEAHFFRLHMYLSFDLVICCACWRLDETLSNEDRKPCLERSYTTSCAAQARSLKSCIDGNRMHGVEFKWSTNNLWFYFRRGYGFVSRLYAVRPEAGQ